MKIVLASASPRRRELLANIGIKDFTVCPAEGEEKAPAGLSPDELVMALSRAKAEEVAAKHPDALIIAADTIVYSDGRVLGKPHDASEASSMLRALSGRTHRVYTGVTLLSGETLLSEAECTLVRFRPLDDAEINAYIATGEPMDKAGAYGIQGMASLMVEGIEGDYFNVMGLPLCRLGKMLNAIGVRLL